MLSLLRDIQSGSLSPSSVGIEERQRCVEHLTAEGYSTVEIAEILKVAERTVLRDRKAIRTANALRIDGDFTAETVGGLIKHAEQTIARLRRLAREKGTPPAVKVDAERVGWDVVRDTVQTLQRLGYLPTAAQEIRGQVTHHVDEAPSLDELSGELIRLENILAESPAGVAPDILDRLTRTKDSVTRLALASEVRSLTTTMNTEVPV